MTLIQRVSSFFLVALALALLGNGVLLCGMVRFYLYQRFEHQVQAAFRTLVAAVEVEDDDVKWEPSDHAIALGIDNEEVDDVRWVVLDEANQLVDHSRNLSPTTPADVAFIDQVMKPAAQATSKADSHWYVLHRSLSAAHPKPISERMPKDFATLKVVVARSPKQIHYAVWQLAALVGGASLAIWLISAILGTTYCRRALQPLHEMVRHASGVRAADFHARLPVGSQRDELAELSTAFNGLLDRLQQAFQQQQRFTGDAAHQLRTPLTVLLGHLDVALRRRRTPEDYEQTLKLLRGQTSELQQMVEALLFLARVEGQGEPPETQACDARDCLQSCVQRWADHERHADLKIIANESILFATSIPLLNQLLDNLVSNAFKYSPAGTPVTLSASRDLTQVVFAVRDQGTGIAPEDQATIFDPFFRSPAARQSGVAGTGLGLAISARIAEALRGRLTCESTLGQGSCFELRLPGSDGLTRGP